MIDACSRRRGDDAGQPVAVLDLRRRPRRSTSASSSGDAACHAGGSPSPRTLAAGDGVDAGQRQQPVGDLEDRLGHAVADRQVGDRPGRRRDVANTSRPALLAGGRGRLGDVADERHRARRAAAADHAQRHRRVVLRLVDDDVAVGERRAVEQRVGLVDEELVGRRPTPALAARPGQHAGRRA